MVIDIEFTIYPLIDHVDYDQPTTYINLYSNLRRLFNEKFPETPNEKNNYMTPIRLEGATNGGESNEFNWYSSSYDINNFWDSSGID
jgi:hypothetical protein